MPGKMHTRSSATAVHATRCRTPRGIALLTHVRAYGCALRKWRVEARCDTVQFLQGIYCVRALLGVSALGLEDTNHSYTLPSLVSEHQSYDLGNLCSTDCSAPERLLYSLVPSSLQYRSSQFCALRCYLKLTFSLRDHIVSRVLSGRATRNVPVDARSGTWR